MLSLFLTLHIAGSFIFIAYVLVGLGSLISGRGSAQLMQRSALVIGTHQVVTGLALGLLSPNMTLLAVCVRGLALVVVLYVLSSAVSHRLAYAPQTTS